MTSPRVYLTILLAVLLVGTLPVAAQDSPDPSTDPDAGQSERPDPDTEQDLPMRGSNRAISFSFDNLSLGTIDGGVGGKWWLSPNTALRASLDFGVESDEDNTEGIREQGLSAVRGGLSALIEWHSADFGRVSPYLGSGFSLGARASSETIDFGGEDPLARRKIKSSALDFGVNVSFGVEVRITRRISLAGEHLFGADVQVGSRDVTETFGDGSVIVTNGDVRNFTLSTGTSSLIVSVYF